MPWYASGVKVVSGGNALVIDVLGRVNYYCSVARGPGVVQVSFLVDQRGRCLSRRWRSTLHLDIRPSAGEAGAYYRGPGRA